MMTGSLRQMRSAFLLLITFSILTGVVYPYLVTEFAQHFLNWQANGSLIEENGKITGSVLIGQPFDSPAYFWGRPSATTPFPYDPELSNGSNMGPSNPALFDAVKQRVASIKNADKGNHLLVPVDLVTASASGLDPEISPFAAYYQAPRIAKARHIPIFAIWVLIKNQTEARTYKILGEPRVNVYLLNMALDYLRIPNNVRQPA